MKKEKKEFVLLREKIKRYNKIIIGILAIFIVYALIHSILILDCNDGFVELGVASSSYSCTNFSNDFYKILRDNYMIISVVLLIAAAVVLVLQKIALLRINQLDVDLLDEEKVNKNNHILVTLLLGYTGLHKFRTENRPIGYIYLVNFIFFGITWLIKTFSETTFNDYTAVRCAYEFSLLFIIGIIILNIIEAIFSFLSNKDEEERIFA